MLRRVLLTLAGAQILTAGEAGEWKTATVVYSQCAAVREGMQPSQNRFSQTAHEEIDLDAGDFTYSTEEWVSSREALRLAVGSKVQFMVKGKALTIQMEPGKTRKLKLLAKYPRHSTPER